MILIGRPGRDVQLVDLALAFEVLELPHPLLAHRVDVHRLGGRTPEVVEHRRAPAEHHHRDDGGDDAPQQLERQVAFDARANLAVVRLVIADAEVDHRHRHGQREERADGEDEEIQRVHVLGERSTPARERWECRIMFIELVSGRACVAPNRHEHESDQRQQRHARRQSAPPASPRTRNCPSAGS